MYVPVDGQGWDGRLVILFLSYTLLWLARIGPAALDFPAQLILQNVCATIILTISIRLMALTRVCCHYPAALKIQNQCF